MTDCSPTAASRSTATACETATPHRTGRITLRAGVADIEFGPCELAADIDATLRRRGYLGAVAPCRPGCVAPLVDMA